MISSIISPAFSGSKNQYQESESEKQYQATVYIWPTKLGDDDGYGTTVGHSSLELKEISTEDPRKPIYSKYISLRPKNPLLVNPATIFFPVKGVNCESLNEDMDLEGDGNSPQLPEVFNLQLNEEQYHKMSESIDTIKNKIEQKKILYQLFPGISVLKLMKMLGSKEGYEGMSKCPFTGQTMGDERYKMMEGLSDIKSYHCAITTAKVLKAAGIKPPLHSTLPWKTTPTELSRFLNNNFENRA